MPIKVLDSIQEIDPHQWNRLVADNHPFVSYEFLSRLEIHGITGKDLDWYPAHLVLRENDNLVGAAICFQKFNTHGEFVFDHAWTDAWNRAGLNYYPKLVSATPFTPATGQRLLASNEQQKRVLIEALTSLVTRSNLSGVHCLFPEPNDLALMTQAGWSVREDCQFHWHNHDYNTFDEFLSRLKRKKRKNIRQQRRKVSEAGITLRVLDGQTASESDWAVFHDFYARIYERKWGIPVFTREFFIDIASALGERVILVMASDGSRDVAGALMYRSNTTLFGRHWGCAEHYDSLHFEACYYQGIKYCIENLIEVFEPGVQGEHKLARGFEPVITRSAHWINTPQFRQPVADFCRREAKAVQQYMQDLQQHSAYSIEQ